MALDAMMNAAVSGMQANARAFSTNAGNIANALTPGYDRQVASFVSTPGGVDVAVKPSGNATFDDYSNVDLTMEIISSDSHELGFKANAAAWETGADLWTVLFSIKRG